MSKTNIPIQLFSACSTMGDLIPLWFRFENNRHEVETVKIEQVLSHKEEKYCGLNYISYICAVVMGEIRHLIELRYHIYSHRWSLFRILS